MILAPKLLYFTVNMMAYAVHTLQTQYLVSRWQMRMRDIGVVSALQGVNFFGAIWWSRIADRTSEHRKILLFAAMAYCATYCGLLLPFGDGTVGVAIVATILTVSNWFYSALFPILDSRVLEMLLRRSHDGEKEFGKQRVWGTLGHAMITIITTEIVGAWSSFEGMFVLLVICTGFFALVVVLCIPAHEHSLFCMRVPSDESLLEEQVTPESCSSDDGKNNNAIELLKDWRFISLLIMVLASGYTRSILAYFQPYYVAISLGKGNRFLSLAVAGRVISESAAYYFAHRVQGLVGAEWMLVMGQAFGLVRLAGYSLMSPDPTGLGRCTFPAVLGLELIKGCSTSLTMTSAVLLANKLAPEGSSSTAQGIYSGVWQGLSMALGGLVGAAVLQSYSDDEALGMNRLFQGSFGAIFLIMIAFLAKAFLMRHLRNPVTASSISIQ